MDPFVARHQDLFYFHMIYEKNQKLRMFLCIAKISVVKFCKTSSDASHNFTV